MTPPAAARLPGGNRLHLQHGPIDLIIEVTGPPAAVRAAETAAITRFETVLSELVPQLDHLRSPIADDVPASRSGIGSIAQRMVAAAALFRGTYRTPMIAVAGAVADEICGVIAAVPGVQRAYVNNGGDIALHLTSDTSLTVGLAATAATGRAQARLQLTPADNVRGLATSGAGGRSFSLGVADAVTVLATRTAIADTAATLIANSVDLTDHPAVVRVPASDLDPDSDLGPRPVTVEVGQLDGAAAELALERGVSAAEGWLNAVPQLGGVVLELQGRQRLIGDAVGGLRPLQPNSLRHSHATG